MHLSSTTCLRSYISKGIQRQGVVVKHRESLQKELCPVVKCPYLCSSDYLMQVFFKSGESCSKLNWPYSTSNAVENTRGRIRQEVALDK